MQPYTYTTVHLANDRLVVAHLRSKLDIRGGAVADRSSHSVLGISPVFASDLRVPPNSKQVRLTPWPPMFVLVVALIRAGFVVSESVGVGLGYIGRLLGVGASQFQPSAHVGGRDRAFGESVVPVVRANAGHRRPVSHDQRNEQRHCRTAAVLVSGCRHCSW
ncbi:hypothetical protein [Mycobacterium lepromatosis]|uniref:hypothetical protein n=1 Tax=Mycobacterium lepromatosis TaxID=480418 RepID=UPI001F3E7E59|nr:hypothetical protein [Mycobacterium lepromatosis]